MTIWLLQKTGNGTTIEVHNYDVYQGNNEVKTRKWTTK